MKERMEMSDISLQIDIKEEPVKNSGAELIDYDLLRRQAEQALDCAETVDYHHARGTCSDERSRAGLLNGTATVEARPSVLGGPDVYALAVGELTGAFESGQPASGRLVTAKERINAVGLLSGGHVKCAANNGFASWMAAFAENPGFAREYTRQKLGPEYNESLFDEIVQNARATVASERYRDWNESILQKVLGDEAGEAIEVLNDVPHEGVEFVETDQPDVTVDQTNLYAESVLGRGSFVFDRSYAGEIEAAVTDGLMRDDRLLLARHAREAIIASVAGAVPNPDLYQVVLS